MLARHLSMRLRQLLLWPCRQDGVQVCLHASTDGAGKSAPRHICGCQSPCPAEMSSKARQTRCRCAAKSKEQQQQIVQYAIIKYKYDTLSLYHVKTVCALRLSQLRRTVCSTQRFFTPEQDSSLTSTLRCKRTAITQETSQAPVFEVWWVTGSRHALSRQITHTHFERHSQRTMC